MLHARKPLEFNLLRISPEFLLTKTYSRGWETTMYVSHYLSKGLQTIMSKTLMPDYKHTAELVFSICLDLSNFMII